MAVVTGLREDIINYTLQLLDLDLFAGIYGNTAELSLSKKELSEQAATEIGKPEYFVGDRKRDLEAGKSLQSKTIYSTWGHGALEDDNQQRADYTLSNPEELLAIV